MVVLTFNYLLMYAEEMDWHKNGRVSFKEFLFTFINWVGFDDDDEREIIASPGRKC